MASIRARRSFIDSMDLSSDINPDLAVVIEDALAFTAQAVNKANDEELSETCSNRSKIVMILQFMKTVTLKSVEQMGQNI